MLHISRMKSLISLIFPLPISTAKPSLVIFLLPSKRYNFYSNPIDPNSLQLKSSMVSAKSLAFTSRHRSLHSQASCRFPFSSSGAIHVIVGTMFAGKTTTLLRPILSEEDLADITSFQVKSVLNLDKSLKSLCSAGNLSEAVRLLWRTGSIVDEGTYAVLLQECIFRKQYKNGRTIHAQMVIFGYLPYEYLKTKLLILYAKSGDLKTAHVLFEMLIEKSLISWNAMIAGYVQKGLEEMGLNLYFEMRQKGLTPDQYTFASIFRACAALAILMHGKQAHALMIKFHIRENVVVNSALMDMYFKCSNLSDARRVFDKSSNRNVVTWTSLLCGYGQHGRVSEVLELFCRMKDEGFKPNYVTFLAVLSACSHGGLVDEGWDYFSSMERDYGIQPRGQHYAAMVDLIGRAGRLQEAYQLVLKSPFKEHSVLWGALLGACRIHGDINLVKLAATKFFEIDPANSGKYVVLSNAYATYGFWDSVAKVRGMMRESGILKEPSYSRIEVQGEVHLFLMADKSHAKFEDINETIFQMICVLKDAGYVPDISY
ncbi:hypothetical protein K2173_009862 [Erythroxylum novogranatense]|uniref:Pentatricopeptide repeat-containing protein n=1 Tax=Erythroxylum novogranatense TaxID=1862640 RepID=A0AAV8SZ64_9ROSI|nr:hypothetical protein K2173_009862 [Erythroxylum novogranatense]